MCNGNGNCVANLVINRQSIARIDRKEHTSPLITQYFMVGHVLFTGQSQSFILLSPHWPADGKTLAMLTSLKLCRYSRALL